MDRQQLEAFAKKNKVPLLIGGAILLVIAAASGGGEGQPPQQVPVRGADGVPVTGDGSGSFPATDDSGLVDMEEWRRGQRREDIEQKERIDTIREEHTCTDPDTGEQEKVPIHTPCQ